MDLLKYEKDNFTNRTGVKTYAEYEYIKRTKEGKKIVRFRTNYVSTIDIPYARYKLK